MKKLVKIIACSLFIIMGSNMNAKETESHEYIKYVNEIVSGFAKEMKKKYNLDCYGSGGRMPHDVEEIRVSFNSYQKSTVEDARKMEVNAIQELLQRINSHEKIRPYLREYPFNTNRVDVMIGFNTKKGGRPLDGSVALVFLAKNKIFYDTAAMVKPRPCTTIYFNEKNEVVKEIEDEPPEEKLIPLMNEPYEDALKILGIPAPLSLNNDKSK